MNQIKSLHRTLATAFWLLTLLLSACGGGGVSEFRDDNIDSPVPSDIGSDGEIIDSPSGEDAASPDEIEALPFVFAGKSHNADANVIISLRGQARGKNGNTITQIRWRQIDESDPPVVIPNPERLENQILVPDFLRQTQLSFQLIVQDSAGQLNASTTTIIVTPSAAFVRVIGDTVNEDQENATFRIRLNTAQANDVEVDYQTADDSALAGIDYQAISGTLIIPAGETEASLNVPIINSPDGEENESFILQITLEDSDGNFRSNIGTMLIRDIQGADGITAPQLQSLPAQTFISGVEIEPLNISNTGGADLLSCTDISLPNGLSVTRTPNMNSCIVSGTPTAVQVPTISQISANNSVGSSTLDIDITINPPPPDLATPSIQNYTVNESINPLLLTNNGGGQLLSCDAIDPLPMGLSIALSDDLSTCQISGTPTELSSSIVILGGAPTLPMFTLRATNVSGNSDVIVTMTIDEPIFSEAISINYRSGTITGDVNVNLGIALLSGTAQIDWGDGSVVNITNQSIPNIGLGVENGGGRASHQYSAARAGNITVSFSQGQTSLRGIEIDGDLAYLLDLNIFENANGLEYINANAEQNSAIDGDLLLLGQNNPLLETLRLEGTIANTGEAPRSGLYLNGNVSNFSRSLRDINIVGFNGVITGLIDNLPPTITQLNLSYPNSIAGDISTIPRTLRTLSITGGENTIEGDLRNIPQSLSSLFIEGDNEISGNIEDLHTTIGAISINGENTIGGDIAQIPADTGLLSISIDGNNRITGDITRIPANILSIAIEGNSDISGDIQNLPSTLFNVFISGNNIISGDIQSLPASINNFQVYGNNTIDGDLGLLANNNISTLAIGGSNTIRLFSTPPLWQPSNLSQFILTGGAGLRGFTSADLDNILILFESTLPPARTPNATITIERIADAQRTTASDAAVVALEALGYNVSIGVARP